MSEKEFKKIMEDIEKRVKENKRKFKQAAENLKKGF